MNKDEINEVREYHFRKIRRLCQEYIDKELDYKMGITDSRIIEIGKLIRKITDENERVNEINKTLYNHNIYNYDNKGSKCLLKKK